MAVITQTLNINNLRNTSAKSITWIFLKKCPPKGNIYSYHFSSYCCPKVGWYCDAPSRAQGTKGLKVQ